MRGFYSGVLEFATFAAVVAATKRTGVGIVTSILAVVGHVQTHTRVSTCRHTHANTHSYTYTNSHSHTDVIYIYMYALTHTHAYTYIHTHSHTSTYAHMHTRPRAPKLRNGNFTWR